MASPLLRTTLRRTTLPRPLLRQTRFQSTSSPTSHFLSGLAGGALVLGAGYTLYSFSAAGRLHSTLSSTSAQAQKAYQSAASQFQQATPDANEAIEYLRKTAYGYAAFIPGGRGYVDAAFKDVDAVREKHGDKVEEIVKDTYGELQEISKQGFTMAALTAAMGALEKMTGRLASEAGDVVGSVMENHPEVKEKVGGQVEELKGLGERLGPKAKEQVEKTWAEVGDVLKGGLGVGTIERVRKLVEQKMEEVRKLGDQAWEEGLEQVKPYLEKNPQVKELVEGNVEALKKGNYGEVFNKVKDSVKSGNVDELKKYVDQLSNSAQEYGEKAWDEGLKQAKPYLDKNPKIKQLVEENADKLKKGDYKELFNKVKSSVESGNIDELKGYVDEVTKGAQDLGQKAWDEGMKQAKPYLDKYPKIKELVEKNADQLKKGDYKQLFSKVKESAESGDVDGLKKHVEEATKKASK
ncbi:hypothetical protein CAC42_4910 [Sphaceloma murrayae]|uniref:Uncharacterized protein n=1 Tax=Sphaceloma murrayae TaxID=2082308 RepID=A0A2K1QPB4_9PEZI|nr:hypothetical protein CAC42_4910 [Sphaceloma murrayae]